jgi:protein arginine N-methyltransferase 1
MSLVLDEHREYVSDAPRIAAFRRAISEVVRPTDVVLDLASGTGILGLLACEAGAARVYSIDGGGLSGIAHELARANGFGERMVFIGGLSTRVELPEKVDLVLADQIGHFGFEAGVIDFFNDARRRFLKPGARAIPSRVDLCVSPVELPEMWRRVEFWNSRPAGFDFAPARSIAANTGYPVRIDAADLLGEVRKLHSIDLTDISPTQFSSEATIVIERLGTMHGIMGCFEAHLSPHVVMSNSPLRRGRIVRRNAFFPIDRPVEVEPGDQVSVAMTIDASNVMVTWRVGIATREGVAKGKFVHSTFKGMLLDKESLRKTRPGFVPKLSKWGEARRSVVDLCDGKRTFEEIRAEVYRRHPKLFASIEEAERFVTEVFVPYAL